MKVLSEWAILESHTHELLVQMLGANPLPAAAMFAELMGNTQRQAIKAVATATLSAMEQPVFDAIFALYLSAAQDRNKLAHWVWGYSTQLPDAVLLCEPEALIEYEARKAVFERGISDAGLNGKPRPETPYPDRERILVYYDDDLVAISSNLQRVMCLISQLTRALRLNLLGNRDARLIAALHQEPEIRQFVSRRRPHPKSTS